MSIIKPKRALLSVSDKSGIIEFAKGLTKLGIEIFSTGGTAKALTDAGYKVNNIKLGTVHALQGAERSIILFSSVYSNEDEGTMFFEKDNKPNMLNVAVSRAKESLRQKLTQPV